MLRAFVGMSALALALVYASAAAAADTQVNRQNGAAAAPATDTQAVPRNGAAAAPATVAPPPQPPTIRVPPPPSYRIDYNAPALKGVPEATIREWVDEVVVKLTTDPSYIPGYQVPSDPQQVIADANYIVDRTMAVMGDGRGWLNTAAITESLQNPQAAAPGWQTANPAYRPPGSAPIEPVASGVDAPHPPANPPDLINDPKAVTEAIAAPQPPANPPDLINDPKAVTEAIATPQPPANPPASSGGGGNGTPPPPSTLEQLSTINPEGAAAGAKAGAKLGAALTLATCAALVEATGEGSFASCAAQALESVPMNALMGAAAALNPAVAAALAAYALKQGIQAAPLIGTALGVANSDLPGIQKTSQLLQPINNAIASCNFSVALAIAQQYRQQPGSSALLPGLPALNSRLQSYVDAAESIDYLLAQAKAAKNPDDQQGYLAAAKAAAGGNECLKKRLPPSLQTPSVATNSGSSTPPTKSTPPPKTASNPPPKTTSTPATPASTAGGACTRPGWNDWGATDGLPPVTPGAACPHGTVLYACTEPVRTVACSLPSSGDTGDLASCKQYDADYVPSYATLISLAGAAGLRAVCSPGDAGCTCTGTPQTTASGAATPPPSVAPSSPISSALSSPYVQPLPAIAAPQPNLPSGLALTPAPASQPNVSRPVQPNPCNPTAASNGTTAKAASANSQPSASTPATNNGASSGGGISLKPNLAPPSLSATTNGGSSGGGISLKPNLAAPSLPAATNGGSSSVPNPCHPTTAATGAPSQQNSNKASAQPASNSTGTGQHTSSLTPSGQHVSGSQTATRRTSSYGRSVGGSNQSGATPRSTFRPAQTTRFSQSRGGSFGGGWHRSDIRLKDDIVALGRLDNGIGLYRFRYKGGDHTVYVGVMAQEVQNIVPRAVSRDRDGFLRVDYDQLGIGFVTWDEWVSRRGAIPQTVN